MKREDLKKLELSDEVIDKIMSMHGADVEKHKADLTTAKAEADGLKTQLAEANKQIGEFKSMDVEAVKKSATDWEAKAKQAEIDAAQKVAALKYDHALGDALTAAKVKNPKAAKALLNIEALKFNEADSSIIGLDKELERIKSSDAYLFNDETPAPQIVAGAQGKPAAPGNSLLEAAMRGAGIPVK